MEGDAKAKIKPKGGRMVDFIGEPKAESAIMSHSRRNSLDVGIPRHYIKVSVSRHIWNYVCQSLLAYDAFNKISELYENTPTQNIADINRRWEMLAGRFW